VDQESLRDIQKQLTLVGELLESASEDPSCFSVREAKRVLRNVTDKIEIETERRFTSVEEFVRACEDLRNLRDEKLKELPCDVRPPMTKGSVFQPWFQPFEDVRRRMLGVREVLSGDRLTLPITALKEAPPEWEDLVRKFLKPEGRKLLAEALTRGDYPRLAKES